MTYTQIHIHNSKYTGLQAGNSISIHSFLFTGKRVATPHPATGTGGSTKHKGGKKNSSKKFERSFAKQKGLSLPTKKTTAPDPQKRARIL